MDVLKKRKKRNRQWDPPGIGRRRRGHGRRPLAVMSVGGFGFAPSSAYEPTLYMLSSHLCFINTGTLSERQRFLSARMSGVRRRARASLGGRRDRRVEMGVLFLIKCRMAIIIF